MFDQLFKKKEVKIEVPYRNKLRRLYIENNSEGKAYCPYCHVALMAIEELRAEHRIPVNRDIEIIGVDTNPNALKELQHLIGRSNLKGNLEQGLAFPTLIYEGTVRVGVVQKDAYKAFLLSLIFGYGYRPR